MSEATLVQQHSTSLFASRLLLVFTLFFLLLALACRSAELTLFCALGLLLFVSASLWSKRVSRKLDICCSVASSRVFAGEKIELVVSGRNSGLLPLWLKVDSRLNALHQGSSEQYSQQFWLSGLQELSTRCHFPVLRRGVYSFSDTSLLTADPFGFYPHIKKQVISDEIIVFPSLVPLAVPAISERLFFGRPGWRSPVEDPIYVSGSREYRGESPARRINWKVSARLNRLSEKVCEPASMGKVLLVIDVDGFASEEMNASFERMLGLSASLIHHFSQQGHQLGLISNGRMIGAPEALVPPDSHPDLTNMFELLARHTAETGPTLEALLGRCIHQLSGAQILLLCLSQHQPQTGAALKLLKTRRMSITLVPALTNTETGNDLRVIPLENLCLE